MNPSEAWALLTLRSKHFARTPGGHGSITTSDVAAMLGGLEREPFLMGMASECGDYDALKQIELCLWTRAYMMSENGEWNPPPGLLRAMVALAIYEVIDDRRCYACNGRGQMVFAIVSIPELVLSPWFKRLDDTLGQVQCIACVGEGQINLSERRKAEIMGLGKDSWRRHWARKYEPIFGTANGWREIAKGHLAGRMKDVEEGMCATTVSQPELEGDRATAANPAKISTSCTISKLHGRVRPGQVAPEANVGHENVDFAPLQRPILRLKKPA